MGLSKIIDRARSRLESAVTPFLAVMVHLILIGIPVGLGAIPLWDGSIHQWMGNGFFSGLFPPSWSMYNDRLLQKSGNAMTPLEAYAVHDMGWRFIYQYELSFVACILLRKTTIGEHLFHKTVVIMSFLTVFAMSSIQYLHFQSPYTPFEPNFFARMVFCHLLAIAFSFGELSAQRYKDICLPPPSGVAAKWSIPGKAIFLGSVSRCYRIGGQKTHGLTLFCPRQWSQAANAIVVVVSFQALIKRHGLVIYFGTEARTSQIFFASYAMGVVHLVLHAFLLFRLRHNLMSQSQLKYLCLYKLIVNLLVPFFWFPEMNPLVQVDTRITVGLRLALTLVYATGFWLAGADKITHGKRD